MEEVQGIVQASVTWFISPKTDFKAVVRPSLTYFLIIRNIHVWFVSGFLNY